MSARPQDEAIDVTQQPVGWVESSDTHRVTMLKIAMIAGFRRAALDTRSKAMGFATAQPILRAMTITASEMGKRSAMARRKKYGGKNGFPVHMSRTRRAAPDNKAIPTRKTWMAGTSPAMTDVGGSARYADFSNSSRPISMRRISLVPAPIS